MRLKDNNTKMNISLNKVLRALKDQEKNFKKLRNLMQLKNINK